MSALKQVYIANPIFKRLPTFISIKKMSSTMLFLVAPFFASNIHALTFDWESAVDNGTTVSQTVGGVTATVSTSGGGAGVGAAIIAGGGVGGSTGNVIISDSPTVSFLSITVTFSSPVNLEGAYVFDQNAPSGNWDFTPASGGNSSITQAVTTSGATVNLNWTDVTGFTITNPADGLDGFGLDNLTFTVPPQITSATYDADTGVLVVTGTNFAANVGALNDVDVSLLTLTGEGGASYTITNNINVEIDSATQFTVTLDGVDLTTVNSLLNNNGTSSTGGTVYNLAVADDFITALTAGDSSDTTNNGITVSLNNTTTNPGTNSSGSGSGGLISPLMLMMLLSLFGLRQRKLAVN